MMDAFLYVNRTTKPQPGFYYMSMSEDGKIKFPSAMSSNAVRPVFDSDLSPVGYSLEIVLESNLPDAGKFGNAWGGCKWLVGRLYNHNGSVDDVGMPFFTVPVCLGL